MKVIGLTMANLVDGLLFLSGKPAMSIQCVLLEEKADLIARSEEVIVSDVIVIASCEFRLGVTIGRDRSECIRILGLFRHEMQKRRAPLDVNRYQIRQGAVLHAEGARWSPQASETLEHRDS